MLKRGKQHRKLNNKGMTLIEVIVTITILVLVSAFILSAFVSSMRTSTKSRNLHRATTVAQNIMEGINLKTAEKLAYQFNYPVVLNSTGTVEEDNFFVYPSTMFQYETKYSVGELFEDVDALGNVTLKVAGESRSLSEYEALLVDSITNAYSISATASAYMSDMTSNTYEFLKDTEGKYIYYMRNLESDGAYYNAKITIDGSAYRASGASSINANSEEIISVPTIDSTYDAVEVMGKYYDSTSMSDLEVQEGETVEPEELHRIIEITVDDALVAGTLGGTHRTTVDVKYIYYFDKEDGTVSEEHWFRESTWDNAGNEDNKKLRNVYLYYYPLYKVGGSTDTIVVNNPDNLDIELYLIKQESPFLGQTELKTKEQNYKVTFNVKETTLNSVGNSHVTLHTNLNESLYAIYSTTPMGELNQVDFRRNGITVTKDMFQMTDIKNKQEKDRMYDVTVEIYKSEKADSFSDFSSADISTWFTEDNHLITMTSSISQ